MSSPVRVLYVAHSVSASGGGMERMGRALVGANVDVRFTVLASEGLEGLPDSVRTVRLALPARPAFVRIGWFYVRSAHIIRRLRRDVDLVHSCGAVTPMDVDVATVHLLHAAVGDDIATERAGWRRWNAALARSLGRRIEHRQYRPGRVRELVAVSPRVAREIETHYDGLSVTTINNGIEVARFVAERAGTSATELLAVVMVCADFALKGVDLALTALVDAPRVRLRIAGDGPVAEYRSRAASLGVSDRVEFLGYVGDLRNVYANADVVVCASHYEAFGLYLVEGALAGCAVVATDVGIARELIGSGEGGVLVARSASAMAAAWNELDADRERTRALGRAAQSRAQRFSTTTMVAAYESLYRSLMVDS